MNSINWISIKEKLPTVGVRILVTDGIGMAVSEYYNDTDPGYPPFSGDDYEWDMWKENITHWALLPELPKKDITPLVNIGINNKALSICNELIKVLDAYEGKKALVSCQGQAMDGYTTLANFIEIAKEAREIRGNE